MAVTISVVVRTRNRVRLLPDCLAALLAQTLGADRWEVLVVDGGSTDGTAALVREFVARHPRIRLVPAPARGTRDARDVGVAVACGTHVAFLDDDARPEPTWLARIADAFATVRPAPAVVRGRTQPRYEVPPPSWFDPDDEVITLGRRTGHRRHRVGDAGSNVAVQRDVLLAHDGFAPAFGRRGRRGRLAGEIGLLSRILPRHPVAWYDPEILVHQLVPARKLRMRHRVRRAFQNGVAQSRIEGLRLVSGTSLRLARKLLPGRRARPPAAGQAARGFVPTGWARRQHRAVRRAERIAYRLGRVLGARLLPTRRRPGTPAS